MARSYQDLHRHSKISATFNKKTTLKKNLIPFLLFILLILTVISLRTDSFITKNGDKGNNKHDIRMSAKTPTNSVAKISPATNKQKLLASIEDIFQEKVGSYSLYVVDLNTNESFGINEEMITTAASVNKIPILAALYYLAGNNEIDLDETVTLRQQDIQDFGTGILRYQKPGSTYSLKTLAQLMMAKSDNTASHILGRLIIGFPRIQQLIEQWGLKQTDMENNKTSNKDMALLMTKIYRGEITNEALTREMLTFMKDSDFEDRLPKLLPESVAVYHKIGNEIRNIHDVGIVDLANRPYYIGVLTNDLIAGEEEIKDAIAKASLLVYEYFKQMD